MGLIHVAIYTLMEGKVANKDLPVKQYREYFKRKLSHLNPQLHNIFSLNHVSTERVNGVFLSPQSVFKLLLKEDEFRVTEELINFFVDCFNSL